MAVYSPQALSIVMLALGGPVFFFMAARDASSQRPMGPSGPAPRTASHVVAVANAPTPIPAGLEMPGAGRAGAQPFDRTCLPGHAAPGLSAPVEVIATPGDRPPGRDRCSLIASLHDPRSISATGFAALPAAKEGSGRDRAEP